MTERDLEAFLRCRRWHEQRPVLLSILARYRDLPPAEFRYGLLRVTRNGPIEQTLMVLDAYADILEGKTTYTWPWLRTA